MADNSNVKKKNSSVSGLKDFLQKPQCREILREKIRKQVFPESGSVPGNPHEK